jgi:uncharacterized BrkB/YihY/UPF0761 family membrane protein
MELPWTPRLLESFEREQRSGAGLLAGGLAYRLFFWLVAFGLLVAAAASFWVREARGSMEDAAKSFGLSGVAAHSASSAVEGGQHARWYLLIAGLALVGYFGLGAVRALRIAAFIAWRIKPTRLRKPVRASATFTGFFALGLVLTMFTSWLREHTALVGLLATIGIVAGYMGLALWMFSLLPHPREATWKTHLPGGALLAVGLTAFHVFVVYYLSAKLERSPNLYGTLGAATVVLLGLYLVARLLVSAMFLNATLASPRGSPDTGDDDRRSAFDALQRAND